MRRPKQDAGIMNRLAKTFSIGPDKRDCQKDGHSFDHSVGVKVYCSLCGRTKAEIEKAAAEGQYEYEAIKYLDSERRHD